MRRGFRQARFLTRGQDCTPTWIRFPPCLLKDHRSSSVCQAARATSRAYNDSTRYAYSGAFYLSVGYRHANYVQGDVLGTSYLGVEDTRALNVFSLKFYVLDGLYRIPRNVCQVFANDQFSKRRSHK